MTPQKAGNHTIEDLVDSEGNESLEAEVRIIISMLNEIKEDLKKDIQNKSMNPRRTWIKNFEKTEITT
jgi:hypothetical protein